LRVRETGRTKQEIFNEILKESGGTPVEAVTAKAPAKKAPADASATDETPGTVTAPTPRTEG
jgi:hypothetical protein